MTMTIEQTLTDDERLANLRPEQLRQLVGLVEHDPAGDPFPINGWDALVWNVGNARQTALHYQAPYGMELAAYAGPETGVRGRQSYVLRSRAVRFVVQGATGPDSPLVAHHARHGDGITDIALQVPDVDRCIAHARTAGATILEDPHNLTDEHGTVRVAAVAAYGDTRHSLVDRSRCAGPYLPGYVAASGYVKPQDAPRRLFQAIDHVVGNVELGRMDEWVEFYQRVMGFTNMAEFIGADIATSYSALMSKVVANGNHRVKFPLNEPSPGQRKSQIDEYLEFYGGPGAQHVALATSDILRTVDQLAARGVEFLSTPDSYFEDPELRARIGQVRVPVEELQRRHVLVDRDEDGYLLRSSPSRSATGPPCSSSSSNATAPSDSARATSRPCSRRSSASKSSAATCSNRRHHVGRLRSTARSTFRESAMTLSIQQAALRSAVTAIPGAALRLPAAGDAWDPVANREADTLPAAIATASTPGGWSRVVRAARDLGFPLVTRGCGWSPAGLGSATGAVVLSAAGLTGIEWAARQRLRVGGGVSAGAAEQALAREGEALTLPVPSNPGVVGAALAGGVSFLLRRLGRNCDPLVGATLVTAAGDIIAADDDTDPELMWALRGAGAQFGLVLSAEFETSRIGSVQVVQQAIDLGEAAAALLDYDRWTAGLPDEVTSIAMMRGAPPLPGVPPQLIGRTVLLLTSVHTGTPAAAQRDLDQLRDLRGVIAERRVTTTLADLRAATDAPFRNDRFGVRTASGWSRGLTAAAAEALVRLGADMPAGESVVEVAAMGGAAARPARPAAAPGRDASHLINAMALWTDPAQRNAHLRWAATARATITALRAGPEIAPGFADLADLGQPGCYGTASERLQEVKKRLDPDGAFSANLTLAPAHATKEAVHARNP
jgi:4-hydroxyphenylpyruvate dioxygenase